MSKKIVPPKKSNKKTGLLAISGGVDSIVLLDLLANTINQKNKARDTLNDLIIRFIDDNKLSRLELAYIDHNQREDTGEDIEAVKKLSDKFDFSLHIISLDLPKDCSEQLARQKRYEALEGIKLNRGIDNIITAHHADDVLETALINLSRGTGPKGLSSLRHQPDGIWRPFLYNFQHKIFITKKDILNYAKERGLLWHEDSTNKTDIYLRNRVRQKLSNLESADKTKFLNLLSDNQKLVQEIRTNTQLLESTLAIGSGTDQTYSTEIFRQLPEELKDHFLHHKINQNGFDVNKESVKRAKDFVQTKTTGKVLQLKGCEIVIAKKGSFSFIALSKH